MWKQFPSSNFSELNMDWVLSVVKDAENVIHNLNNIISEYVTRMTLTLNGEIKAGNAQSKQYARVVESRVNTKMEQLLQQVSNKLYINSQQMNLLLTQVKKENSASYNKNQQLLQMYAKNYDLQLAQLRSQLSYTVVNINTDMQTLESFVNNTIEDLTTNLDNVINEFKYQVKDEIEHQNDTFSQALDIIYDDIKDILALISRNMQSTKQLFEEYDIIFTTKLNNKVDFDAYAAEIKNLTEKIDNINVNTSIVLNPISGKMEDIDSVLDQIYKSIKRPWSLTVEEYDALKLTPEQYDKYHVTVWEYEYLARWYLIFKPKMMKHFHRDLKRLREEMLNQIEELNNKFDQEIAELKAQDEKISTELEANTHMISPVNGNYELISQVIKDLVQVMKDGRAVKAGYYDSLNITAEAYDNAKITRYQYDWNGMNYIGGL